MTPEEPGIYIAKPIRPDLVPVTRDRRHVDTCARVNCNNVKVGKALNLALREKNYHKDFDPENIQFIPLAIMKECSRAESSILGALRQYRMRSPKGRPMDWLEGISPEEATATIFAVLKQSGIEFRQITQ